MYSSEDLPGERRPPVGSGAGSGGPRGQPSCDRRVMADSTGLSPGRPELDACSGLHCLLRTARFCLLRIGLVGPMSNYAAPPQLVEGVPYRDMEEMHQFAARWRDEHRGQWFCTPKLSGFCLLMKRAVYDKIGGLDERFGMGFFDDDDLAERARRAGFELAVAHDLFVHHFGSRTFAGNGIDAGKMLDENAGGSPHKWGLRRPADDGLRCGRGRQIQSLTRT